MLPTQTRSLQGEFTLPEWEGPNPLHGGFLRAREAGIWAEDLSAPDETVIERLNRFHPDDVPEETAKRIRPLLNEVVPVAEAKVDYTAGELATVVTQLAWWCDRVGLDLEKRVVLDPSTVDRFHEECAGAKKDGTLANYRSILRGVGRAVLGAPMYPPNPVATRHSERTAPYSDSEIADVLAWGRGLSTKHRRTHAELVLALSLGAGLKGGEVSLVVGTDVQSDGAVVSIDVFRSRRTVVTEVWEEVVLDRAQSVGQRPLFRPERQIPGYKDVDRFLSNLKKSAGPRLTPRRLRATWIVQQLAAGTPVPVVAAAAGVECEQVAGYAEFQPSLDGGESDRLLREAVRL